MSEEAEASKFSWPNVIALVAVIGGVFWLVPPLTSSRPLTGADKSGESLLHTVDARLWQDPLAVAYAHEENTHKPAEKENRLFHALALAYGVPQSALHLDIGSASPADERSRVRHEIGTFVEKLKSEVTTGKVLLVAVMVPGGPYAEDGEMRLRYRNAVVNGLARSGYEPTDSEHINYFKCNWPTDRLVLTALPLALSRAQPSEPPDFSSLSVFPKKRVQPLLPEVSSKAKSKGRKDLADAKPLLPSALVQPDLSSLAPASPSQPLERPDLPSLTVFPKEGVQPLLPAASLSAHSTLMQPDLQVTQTVSASKYKEQRAETNEGENIVSYEWWKTPDGQSDITALNVPSRAVVLWLRDDAFADTPIAKIAWLRDQIHATGDARISVRVIGPTNSTMLRAMLDEAGRLESTKDDKDRLPAETVRQHLAGVKMYAALPTAAERLLTKQPDGNVSDQRRSSVKAILEHAINGESGKIGGFQFVRTILNDETVIEALIQELKRRGVDVRREGKPDFVAIISEWDTFYGRALPRTFAAKAAHPRPDKRWNNQRDEWAEHGILRFQYLRGIDGKLPGDDEKTKGGEPKGAEAKTAEARKARESSETSEGSNQADYLRRLAATLVEKDRQLVKQTNGRGLKAVGILGSDVYDKLMVLRSLRKALPGVIFFTDNLDSRLALPAEWHDTHNLIVGSGFGLCLRQDLQDWVPPFRNSYQTSMFAATLMATGVLPPPDTSADLGAPRLYEIGRHGAYDISIDPKPAQSKADPRETDPPPGIQPVRVNILDCWNWPRRFAAAGVLMLGALLLASTNWLFAGSFVTNVLLSTRGWMVFSLLFVIVSIWSMAQLCWPNDEPFALFDGVSMWPSEALKLLAGLLTIHFVFKTRHEIRHNNRELERDFDLERPNEEFAGHVGRWSHSKLFDWQMWSDWLNAIRVDRWQTDAATGRPGGIDRQTLWNQYRGRGSHVPRRQRIIPLSAVYYGFGLCLTALLGWPDTPSRGPISDWTDFVIAKLFAIPLVIFLTFYVVDSMRLNSTFITHLADGVSGWSSLTLNKLRAARKMPDEVLIDSVTISLIASRTKVVGKLIYYPFIALSLLIIARISYFDDWDWPPGLVIMDGLSVLYAVVAALMLRKAAEDARSKTLERLRVRFLEYTAENRQNEAKVAEETMKEVAAVREGAFGALSQHPLVAALLLPSGSVGIWALLQYLPTF
jgi:hypothetical protein